jgi:ketosteroid isomerase-like protein
MTRLWAAIVAVTVGNACAGGAPTDQAADRAAIAEATAATQAAENAGSVEGMRPHFTDDVVMMAPNMPAVFGADGAYQALQGFFATFRVQIEYTSQEVVAVDDWGYDRGVFRHTLTPKAGGSPISENGNYLWIYRRAADGAWKQSRVIWNSSDPLPTN